ncbi:MAG: hypothetical protein IT443_09075 [Phycisphaeraceae bacterium]|nr:hypothetical protein [Phycisphaeraceae bacterium]
MGRENQFCAELFAKLHPWVDHDQGNRVMSDEGAGRETAIPDLELWLKGAQRPLRIEVKIARGPTNTVVLQKLQVFCWSVHGPYRPDLWIMARNTFEPRRFFLLTARQFQPLLWEARECLQAQQVQGGTDVMRGTKAINLGGVPITEAELWGRFWLHVAHKGYFSGGP